VHFHLPADEVIPIISVSEIPLKWSGKDFLRLRVEGVIFSRDEKLSSLTERTPYMITGRG